MEKIQQLQATLVANNIDMALVTTPDNIFYFSKFDSDPHERLLALAVFKDAEPFIICPAMEVPDVKATGFPYEVVGHLDTDNAWDIVANTIAKRNVSLNTIAIEKAQLTVERYEVLQNLYPAATFTRIDETVNQMRVIKSEAELEIMRRAAAMADFAIQVGVDALEEGKTEMDVLNEIESAVKAKGYAMSFDTMVLYGEKSASPHGTPGDKKLAAGDMVLFDLGVIVDGYCSDITRTVAFKSFNEKQEAVYNAVRAANEAAIALVRPGVRAMDLDKAARDEIANAGFGEYFTHRLGHGLGISVHEFPSIHGSNELVLEKGMVFTIEPGVYKADVTGVRIEDDVVVTEDGIEVLTKFTKELIVVQ